ncbi:MAG: alpha/beta family hydrolase [Anaerolineae bacterium]|jgi:pimeloyl-ACP methyl ester carboxylesterase|nr:alpha/beta hydrolase [Chloroflexota bacterium]
MGEGDAGFYGEGYDGLGWEAVEVEQDRWLAFGLPGRPAETGLILYPGARIDPRAYAPAARMLAGSGYYVVIVPMPLRFALLHQRAADAVIKANPQVQRWVIGGHSLGGVAAADYVCEHPARVVGLVLWAAYPSAGCDLSQAALPVLSLYGTRDRLTTPADVERSRSRLPADARYVAIEGGNHAGFGYYGSQSGDQEASISLDEQQRQIVRETLALLKAVEAAGSTQSKGE